MPKRKHTGSKIVKRRRIAKRKRRTAILRRLPLVKFGAGFPQKVMIKHRYVENFTIASVTGSDAVYKFRCNGMFDPNNTSTGHQPMYYDQMAAIYNHWVVLGSKITYKVVQTTSSNVAGVITTFVDDDTNLTSTNPYLNAEYEQTRTTIVAPGSDKTIVLQNRFSAKKWYGKNILANEALKGSASSDPSEQCLYVFNYRSIDGSSSSTMYVEAIVEYIAIWFEPKDVGSS